MTVTVPRQDRLADWQPLGPQLPAWPVLALFWGLPAWWSVGMLPFISIVFAIPMFAFMLRAGPPRLYPGVLPFVALTLWTLPTALMLDTMGRVAGYAINFGQFASFAILLVYVTNARQSLPVGRLLSALTFVWFFIIVGGYLGMLFPETTLTMTIGRILPGSLIGNEYMSSLVFPPFAEIQTPYGAEEPFMRPSAPFTFTNGWGAGMAILTPVALAWATHRRTPLAIALLLGGIAAAIPPSIATSNRGLFLGLAVGIGYMVVRLAFRGKWLGVMMTGIVAAVIAVLFVALGLVSAITDRQDVVDTTAGRSQVYLETFLRTLESPILGYGSPRPSYTTEVSAGTQGMVWDMMFSYGFVGLGLFLFFLVGAIVRTWKAPSIPSLWLHASLVATAVLSVFYGLDRHLLFIVIIAGILLRESQSADSRFWRQPLSQSAWP